MIILIKTDRNQLNTEMITVEVREYEQNEKLFWGVGEYDTQRSSKTNQEKSLKVQIKK